MTTLIVPNTYQYIYLLQAFVIENAKLYGLDKKEILSKLELVCEEAFSYLIKNSFEENEKKDIKVKISKDSSSFIISFFDQGLPFDNTLEKKYDVSKLSAEGLELFLIKKYTDHIVWINHGSQGKEFRLSFNLPFQNIFDIEKSEERIENKYVVNKDDIEVRTFQEKDAIKIARIIYRTYGYTYPNEDLYYPDKILNLNKSGELISIVSYDKLHDEIVGHYGLERPNLMMVAESGQAVVAPKYRSFGLMKKMRNLVENKARELGLEGIFSQPVTTHTFSQQVNEDFGSHVCGFSFGLVPQKMNFKQADKTLSQRGSCVLYFKTLKKRERTINIPNRHRAIVKEIYKNISLPYKIINRKKTLKEGKVTSNYSSYWGIGTINVEKIAQDNFKQIKEAFYNLIFRLKADVIFLNITVEETDIDDLIERVEKEKFFFTGIHPSIINNQDAIRFEYLNGIIDESQIKIYSSEARKIFNYISSERQRVLQ